MLSLLRRCDYLVGRHRRTRWLMLVLLAGAVGALEAVGAFLVFGLLALITGAEANISLPFLDSLTASAGDESQRASLLVKAAAVVAGFFLLRAAVFVGQTYAQFRMANNAGVELSRRLLHGYLRMPYVEHLRRNSAEMIRNAHESVDVVARFALVPLVTLASQLLLALAIAMVLFILAPLVTLLAVAVLGPLVFLLLRVLQPRLAQIGGDSQDMARASLQAVQQTLHGVRDVTLLGRQREFEQQFTRHRTRLAKSYYLQATYVGIPRVALETAFIIVVLGFLVVTAMGSGSVGGALALLGLFAYSVLRLLPAVNQIVTSLNYLKFGAAATANVYNDLIHLEAAVDPEVNVERPSEPLLLRNELRFEDVAYVYPGTEVAAIESLTVAVRAGESIGIVGGTGGGKSTVVDLLVGLLQPTSGRITVDGVDIQDDLDAWQQSLGVVSQSVFLLDETLRRNIAFGVPDADVDAERLVEAVHLAQLDSVINSLPDGLETLVGEHGVRLSGGQRQRVAIARALYRRPAVLVLDEGTSALDNQTEADLVLALERLRGTRTLFTVAHRLSTVRTCDRVLVLEAGRVVEQGRYDELVGRDSHLRRLAQSGG